MENQAIGAASRERRTDAQVIVFRPGQGGVELRRIGAYTQQDLVRERDEIAKGILKQIQKEVENYAQKQSFSLILDERQLLYGQKVYDVTDEVLKALNAKDSARR